MEHWDFVVTCIYLFLLDWRGGRWTNWANAGDSQGALHRQAQAVPCPALAFLGSVHFNLDEARINCHVGNGAAGKEGRKAAGGRSILSEIRPCQARVPKGQDEDEELLLKRGVLILSCWPFLVKCNMLWCSYTMENILLSMYLANEVMVFFSFLKKSLIAWIMNYWQSVWSGSKISFLTDSHFLRRFVSPFFSPWCAALEYRSE